MTEQATHGVRLDSPRTHSLCGRELGRALDPAAGGSLVLSEATLTLRGGPAVSCVDVIGGAGAPLEVASFEDLPSPSETQLANATLRTVLNGLRECAGGAYAGSLAVWQRLGGELCHVEPGCTVGDLVLRSAGGANVELYVRPVTFVGDEAQALLASAAGVFKPDLVCGAPHGGPSNGDFAILKPVGAAAFDDPQDEAAARFQGGWFSIVEPASRTATALCAVVFDFDDTLVLSEEWKVKSFDTVVEESSVPEVLACLQQLSNHCLSLPLPALQLGTVPPQLESALNDVVQALGAWLSTRAESKASVREALVVLINAVRRAHPGGSRYTFFDCYAGLVTKVLDAIGQTCQGMDADVLAMLDQSLSTGEQLSVRYSAACNHALVNQAEVVRGTQALLTDLKERSVPLFVNSVMPEEDLKQVVAGLGWAKYFFGVFGKHRWTSNDAVNVKVQNLRRIREVLSSAHTGTALSAQQFLMVGDSATDLRGARDFGAVFAGLTDKLTAYGGKPFLPPALLHRDCEGLMATLRQALDKGER